MKKICLFISALAAVLLSCTRFDEVIPEPQPEATDQSTRAGEASPNNPYSLANMQQALDDLLAERHITKPLKLTASHYYVRFLPQDTTHFDILHDSLNLELFDYPLDRMLSDDEAKACASELTGGYAWQYTIVPTDFVFPTEIEHQILDRVYIQTEGRMRQGLTLAASDPAAGGKIQPADSAGALPETVPRGMRGWPAPQVADEMWEALVERAMLNTGNAEPGPSPSGAWYPSAKIMYEDDGDDRTIPLEGVRIRVSHFINVGSEYTDASGEVGGIKGWGGKFRHKVRYKIMFESDRSPDWILRDGRSGVAKIKGPKQKSHWDYTIRKTDMRESAFAAVHRAVHHFYCKQDIVTKATSDLPTMRVAVIWDEEGDDDIGNFNSTRRWFGGNPIKIWGKSYRDGKYLDRYVITRTAFHELGHSSHWQTVINVSGVNRNTHYHNAETKMKESYATAVEYYFMRELYPDKILKVNSTYHDDYTGVGVGLLYQGYSIQDLQNTVCRCKTWDEWKGRILDLHIARDQVVKMLFAYPLKPWHFNLEDMIVSRGLTYPDTEITFEVPEDAFNCGMSVRRWYIGGIPGGDCQQVSIADDQSSVTVKYRTLGRKDIELEMYFPDGSTIFRLHKTIDVLTPAYMTGSLSPMVGMGVRYRINNFEGELFWSVGNYDWRGEFVPAYGKYIEVSQSGNDYTIVPCEKGKYVVRAQCVQDGVRYDVDELAIDVPCEVIDYTYAHNYEIKLRRIYTYKLTDVPQVDHRLETASYDGWAWMGSQHEWKAFPHRPTPSNPCYRHLIPVYLAYLDGRWHSYATGSPDATDHFPLCYISSVQTAGTVPLYSIEESRAKDEKLVYKYGYLSRENVPSVRNVTSWVWNWLGTKRLRDKDWTETKNCGIAGYAYPL